ncbi:MAG: Dabb family protein [Desulfobulbaceae bacterium]|nr:Dabb family protein [Desulfobulbaceae bacterium]
MLKRIMMWRLNDVAQEQQKKDNGLAVKDRLEQLTGKIPEIEHFKVALNIADDPAAADVVLISFFADRPAYLRFLDHPEHKKVMEFVESVTSERWFVEYEG